MARGENRIYFTTKSPPAAQFCHLLLRVRDEAGNFFFINFILAVGEHPQNSILACTQSVCDLVGQTRLPDLTRGTHHYTHEVISSNFFVHKLDAFLNVSMSKKLFSFSPLLINCDIEIFVEMDQEIRCYFHRILIIVFHAERDF